MPCCTFLWAAALGVFDGPHGVFVFHIYIIHAHAFLLALYVLPYIVQAGVANAHVQGKYRHTFWAEVY